MFKSVAYSLTAHSRQRCRKGIWHDMAMNHNESLSLPHQSLIWLTLTQCLMLRNGSIIMCQGKPFGFAAPVASRLADTHPRSNILQGRRAIGDPQG